MISHKHRFIFVHVGRTGGSSLERLAGIDQTNDPRTSHTGNTDFSEKHATFSDYYRQYPKQFPHYFKFTIIRNPYERLVSAWFWRCTIVKDHQCSFLEFALSRPENWSFKSRLELEHLCFSESVDTFDFVARYENINSDLRYICSQTGLDYSKYPHTNKTEHLDYWKYYDDKTMKLVTKRFRLDIEYFDYTFGK